jgi:hypothetical protein
VPTNCVLGKEMSRNRRCEESLQLTVMSFFSDRIRGKTLTFARLSAVGARRPVCCSGSMVSVEDKSRDDGSDRNRLAFAMSS